MDTNKKKAVVIKSLLALAVLAVLAIAFWNGFFERERILSDGDVLENLRAASEVRDFGAAIKEAEDLLSQNITPTEEYTARMLLSRNLFRTGDVRRQEEAVEIIKDIVNDSNVSDQGKAYAINRAINFYYSGRSSHIFESIFAGEPFAFLLEEGEEKMALLKLAEFSMELFPTSFAILRAANWYSGELLDNRDLSEEVRAQYRQNIKDAVVNATKLFQIERQYKVGVSADSASALHKHWLGYNLAVVTASDPSDPQLFEESFQAALYMFVPGKDGSNVIATTISFTHFYYAAFLHDIFGEGRSEDQKFHLDTLADMVQADPELYQSGFLNLANVEKDRSPETRDHNYRWFVELSAISPKFKELLRINGWDL